MDRTGISGNVPQKTIRQEEIMIVRTLAAAAAAATVAAFLAAPPALASHCPQDLAAIDAALAGNPSLSEAEMPELKELRARGEEEQEAGVQPASEATQAEGRRGGEESCSTSRP